MKSKQFPTLFCQFHFLHLLKLFVHHVRLEDVEEIVRLLWVDGAAIGECLLKGPVSKSFVVSWESENWSEIFDVFEKRNFLFFCLFGLKKMLLGNFLR